jgi:hypothetical protein
VRESVFVYERGREVVFVRERESSKSESEIEFVRKRESFAKRSSSNGIEDTCCVVVLRIRRSKARSGKKYQL